MSVSVIKLSFKCDFILHRHWNKNAVLMLAVLSCASMYSNCSTVNVDNSKQCFKILNNAIFFDIALEFHSHIYKTTKC